MDKIILEHIEVTALIGTLPEERTRRQRLFIDLELELDLSRAAASDDLTHSVDYAEIERRTVELAENSSYFLLEALTGAIGKLLLSYAVFRARVRVSKPAGSRAGRAVAVEMEFVR